MSGAPTAPSFEGAVLAGGASRRMGRDKAFVRVDGRPLVAMAVDALADAGADRVIVVGGPRDRLEALGLHVVDDDHPGEGPLGGIVTALRATTADTIVVLPCDLIGVEAAGVRELVAALAADDRADAVAVDLGGPPTHVPGAWRRRALPALAASFAAGERAPRRATARLVVRRLVPAHAPWWRDADEPADLPAERPDTAGA